MDTYVFIAEEEDVSIRIDKFLSDKIEDISRAKIKEIFDNKQVFLNSGNVKPSYQLKLGDVIKINVPEVVSADILPENIPLNIVYEDDDVAVIDKVQGMVVHPAAGNYSGTLVNALMYHLSNLSAINGVIRPGIVHRIDKDTSGLLVVAKNDNAHLSLAEQFSKHSVTRLYKCFVHGTFSENEGIINAPIGRDKNDRKAFTVTAQNAKTAVTHYKVLERHEEYTLLELKLETGRTHQIRVHMKYISHPVIGDKLYGRESRIDKMFSGQLLHAAVLGFTHPASGEYLEFHSELPDYFSLL